MRVSLTSTILRIVAFLVFIYFNNDPFDRSASINLIGRKSSLVICDPAITIKRTLTNEHMFRYVTSALNALKYLHYDKFKSMGVVAAGSNITTVLSS